MSYYVANDELTEAEAEEIACDLARYLGCNNQSPEAPSGGPAQGQNASWPGRKAEFDAVADDMLRYLT